MVRLRFIDGSPESEEICRCDVKDIKKKLHPGRCASNKKCPVRVHLEGEHEPVLDY